MDEPFDLPPGLYETIIDAGLEAALHKYGQRVLTHQGLCDRDLKYSIASCSMSYADSVRTCNLLAHFLPG